MWRSLAREFETQGVVFTHWESTWPSTWYPPPHELRTPDAYTFDPRRDWTLNAANVITHDARYGPWNNLHILRQPTGITHLWYHKRWRADPRLLAVERILTARLKSDHPHVADMLAGALTRQTSSPPAVA